MEFTLSRIPLQDNPSCAYCGRIFNEEGLTLRLELDDKRIDFPLCQRCFDLVPRVDAVVNLEARAARLKR